MVLNYVITQKPKGYQRYTDDIDDNGKSRATVLEELWHQWFSFCHAITILLNEVTAGMDEKESTDVPVVRQLLWTEVRRRMGYSERLDLQWAALQENWLDDMTARPVPSRVNFLAERLTGITDINYPLVMSLKYLDESNFGLADRDEGTRLKS